MLIDSDIVQSSLQLHLNKNGEIVEQKRHYFLQSICNFISCFSEYIHVLEKV